MQYNDTSNYEGIIQEIERLTDLGIATISGVTATLKNFTAMVNNHNHRIWSLIFKNNGNWQYDDGNQTDLPSASADLVASQVSYALPNNALTIQRVDILDSVGNGKRLRPMTKEMTFQSMKEFMKTPGIPQYYRPVGNSVFLYPPANYNYTGGLKVFFDRDSVDFATSDTTKTPGFASPFHKLLPLRVAIEWLTTKQPTNPSLPRYEAEQQRMEIDLANFYNSRFKDLKPAVTRQRTSWK